jgi:hypothetical protein
MDKTRECELFVAKIWEPIEQRLKKRERLYYVGGTLCVDHDNTKFESDISGIALNLNGKGFVYNRYISRFKNDTLYVPVYVLKLVREIYLELKGETDHYKKEVLGQ